MRRPLSIFVCILVPGCVLFAGFIAGGIYGLGEIPRLVQETARGEMPKGFEVQLDEAGKYTLWLHVRATGDGQHGLSREELAADLPPGAEIFVYDAETKNGIPLYNWLSASKNIGGETAVSIGTFDILRPGQRVMLKGTGFRKPVLVSISPSNVTNAIQVVLVLLAIVIGTIAAAIFLFVYLFHRRKQMVDKEKDHSHSVPAVEV